MLPPYRYIINGRSEVGGRAAWVSTLFTFGMVFLVGLAWPKLGWVGREHWFGCGNGVLFGGAPGCFALARWTSWFTFSTQLIYKINIKVYTNLSESLGSTGYANDYLYYLYCMYLYIMIYGNKIYFTLLYTHTHTHIKKFGNNALSNLW